MLWQISEGVLLVAGVFALLGITELGFRYGRRRRAKGGSADVEHAQAVQSSLISILALLMGFTFFMAISRFDLRKSLLVEEANAIGTAYLRTRVLSDTSGEAVRGLLRRYVDARLAFGNAGADPTRVAAAEQAAEALHVELWDAAVAAVAADSHSLSTAAFMQAINDVIDLQSKRRAAFENHVPEAVLDLLLMSSLFALGAAGFTSGLGARRRFIPNAALSVIVVLVLVTILDVDRPRRGLIEVSQDCLVRLQVQLAADAPSK